MKSHPWLYIILPAFLGVIVALAGASWVSNAYSPRKWAEQAPLNHSVVGSADPFWTRLDDAIKSSDRAGVPMDELVTIIQTRPDNPNHDLVPIPYNQWVSGQYDH